MPVPVPVPEIAGQRRLPELVQSPSARPSHASLRARYGHGHAYGREKWPHIASTRTTTATASVVVGATDGFGCISYGRSPFSVGVGCSVVFRFAEFGVVLVECRALFPESGFVSVKAPFEFRERCVFSCERLVSL